MTLRDNKLVHEILLNNGITLDIKTNRKIDHTTGYMVAIGGCEKVIPTSELTLKVLSEYIDKHIVILNQKRYFLGAWVNDGKVYLDVSKHSSKLTSAKWLGNLEGQLAIYDLENNCDIKL